MAVMSGLVMSRYEPKALTLFAMRDWMVVILLVISFLTFSSLRLYTKNTMMMLIVTSVRSIDMNSTAFTLDL